MTVHPRGGRGRNGKLSDAALFENILVNPGLYLSSLNLASDTLVFTPMSPDSFRSSDFLDSRIHRALGRDVTMDARTFVDLCDRFNAAPQPLSFVFHTGYCCSTLLARCLEGLNRTLVLKEPDPLRLLSQLWFTKGRRDDLPALCRVVATLMARRFDGEPVVVKATSHCSNLMPGLLELHAGNRAIFLYAGLEDSLACYLKDPLRRREARFYLSFMGELLPSDQPLGPHFALSDAQVAALLWIVQVRSYCHVARSLPGDRLLALNCNAFLEAPIPTLDRVASHLGLSPGPDASRQVVDGDAFRRYAKDRRWAFDGKTRRAHLDRSAERHAKEIAFATEWARSLPIWSDVPATLPNELEASP